MTDTPPFDDASTPRGASALSDGMTALLVDEGSLGTPPAAHPPVAPASVTDSDAPSWSGSHEASDAGGIAATASLAVLAPADISDIEGIDDAAAIDEELPIFHVTGQMAATLETDDIPAPPRRATYFGPTGKMRRPTAVIALSILTLGIYWVAWYGRINTELRDFDPSMVVRPSRARAAIAWPFAFAWMVGLVGMERLLSPVIAARDPWMPALPTVPVHFSVAIALAVMPLLATVIMALLPFSIVGATMTLARIRDVEDRVGLRPEAQVVPSRVVWNLLVPTIGGLRLGWICQNRLNAVWAKADECEGAISAA